jgi:hypothetical protein
MVEISLFQSAEGLVWVTERATLPLWIWLVAAPRASWVL